MSKAVASATTLRTTGLAPPGRHRPRLPRRASRAADSVARHDGFVLVVTSPPAMLRQLTAGATLFKAWAVRASIVAWWERAWPPGALAVAALVNVAWIGLIGYGLVRLLLVTAQAGS